MDIVQEIWNCLEYKTDRVEIEKYTKNLVKLLYLITEVDNLERKFSNTTNDYKR